MECVPTHQCFRSVFNDNLLQSWYLTSGFRTSLFSGSGWRDIARLQGGYWGALLGLDRMEMQLLHIPNAPSLTNKCYCLILQIKSNDQIRQSMLHYWIHHSCIILLILLQLIWKNQNPENCSNSKFLIVFPWKSGKISDHST